MIALNVLLTILQQGLCYALVAMGVYITYKILDFPDLTVDGSFPLGGVVCVMLVKANCPFYIALVVALLAGGIAGLVTGLLHVKCKISNLLSGILTMTGLLSVTLSLSKLRTIIPYSTSTHLFNNSFVRLFGDSLSMRYFANVIILIIIVILAKILIDLFLKQKPDLCLEQ